MLSQTTFLILIWILILFAIVVTGYIAISSNTIYATFSLVIVFFAVSFILLLINVEFLGILYLAIYVGAISVFFLFVLFLFDLRIDHVAEKKSNKIMPASWILGIYTFLTFIFGAVVHHAFKKDKVHGPMVRWLLEWREKQLRFNQTKPITELNSVRYEPIELRNYINQHQQDISLSFSESTNTIKQCAPLLNEIHYQSSHSAHQMGFSMYNDHYVLIIISAVILLLSMVAGLALVVNTPFARKNTKAKAPARIEKRIERLKIKVVAKYIEELEEIEKREALEKEKHGGKE